AGACVLQHVGGCVGELEGVVEFAVGQQPGIAGDVGPVEFEAEAAIELGSKWLCLAVTHQRSLSGWQETSENPGNPGGFAQVLCHTQGFIWEIRVIIKERFDTAPDGPVDRCGQIAARYAREAVPPTGVSCLQATAASL